MDNNNPKLDVDMNRALPPKTHYEDFLEVELATARRALLVDSQRITQLVGLCAQAADALTWCKRHHREITPKGNERNALITELRKAAQ